MAQFMQQYAEEDEHDVDRALPRPLHAALAVVNGAKPDRGFAVAGASSWQPSSAPAGFIR